MTEEFKKEIQYQINVKGVDLFYNTNGNKNAFKLFVRHLSYAEKLGYGKVKDNLLKLNKNLYLVNFECESITYIKAGSELKIENLIELD